MMDYIAGLVQRGLISPDAAQGLVQQVADLKQRPFESGGGAPTNSVYTPRGAGQQIEGYWQGRDIRTAPGAQTSRQDAIAQGLKDGKSYGQMAKELGISRNAVAGTVRDLGLTKDPMGPRDPYNLDPVELENTRARLNPGEKVTEGYKPSAYSGTYKQPAPYESPDPEYEGAMNDWMRKQGIFE